MVSEFLGKSEFGCGKRSGMKHRSPTPLCVRVRTTQREAMLSRNGGGGGVGTWEGKSGGSPTAGRAPALPTRLTDIRETTIIIKQNENAQYQTHQAEPKALKAQALFVDVCARAPPPPAGANASGPCAGRAAPSGSPEPLSSARIPPVSLRRCIPSSRQCPCAGHGGKGI